MRGKLGFWGAGKMAEGILAAAARRPDFDPKKVLMAERDAGRAAELHRRYGVGVTADVRDVVRAADTIFLAVRPQDVEGVAAAARPLLTARHLIVSIVAGKKIATLRKRFGRAARFVRVMPNLALRAGAGMCAVAPAANATEADVRRTRRILDAAGRTVVLPERHFDAVTALSGSGPAFFAEMARAMAAGGKALGLPQETALQLSLQTMYGTAKFLCESQVPLDDFIAGVATPGGTTAAGMDVLNRPVFAETVSRTLAAAAARSAELGKR